MSKWHRYRRIAHLVVSLSLVMPVALPALAAAEESIRGAAESSSGTSESSPPAWLQPDVLAAALRIGLTAEQKPLFRDALTTMVTSRQKNTRNLLRRHNVTHLKRKLRTATHRQMKKMDRQMASFLSTEQLPRYHVYSALLKAHLTGTITTDSNSSSTRHTDGIGTHNPDWH